VTEREKRDPGIKLDVWAIVGNGQRIVWGRQGKRSLDKKERKRTHSKTLRVDYIVLEKKGYEIRNRNLGGHPFPTCVVSRKAIARNRRKKSIRERTKEWSLGQ